MSECEKYLEMISAQIDHELSPEEERELERHLESCPSCRKVKEAFGTISGAMDEELVQPPENLAASVMQKIRESDKSGEDRNGEGKNRSSKRIHIKRYLALAACAALIIFTASSQLPKIYGSTGEKGVSSRSADEAVLFEAGNTDADAPAEAEARVGEDTSRSEESIPTQDTEGGSSTPEPQPQEAPDGSAPEPESASQEYEGQMDASYGMKDTKQGMGDTLSQLFSDWNVSLSDPGAVEPFYRYADSQGPAELLGFLGNVLDEDAGEVPGEAPTVIITLSGDERSCRLSVWSGGENILCLYSEISTVSVETGGEVFFKTDGSAESFISYINTLRNLAA